MLTIKNVIWYFLNWNWYPEWRKKNCKWDVSKFSMIGQREVWIPCKICTHWEFLVSNGPKEKTQLNLSIFSIRHLISADWDQKFSKRTNSETSHLKNVLYSGFNWKIETSNHIPNQCGLMNENVNKLLIIHFSGSIDFQLFCSSSNVTKSCQIS